MNKYLDRVQNKLKIAEMTIIQDNKKITELTEQNKHLTEQVNNLKTALDCPKPEAKAPAPTEQEQL